MAKKKAAATEATAETKDKRANFVRIVTKRVSNAVKQIRGVGKLSNKNAYQYSEEDISKIVKLLETEITEMAKRFSASGPAAQVELQLD